MGLELDKRKLNKNWIRESGFRTGFEKLGLKPNSRLCD